MSFGGKWPTFATSQLRPILPCLTSLAVECRASLPRVCRTVFDSLDRDKDGLLNHVEMEFGLKTVNKNIISLKETQ